MRNTSWFRLLATGAFTVLVMAPLSMPSAAGAGDRTAVPTACTMERSVVNGQVIDMPACRILTTAAR